MLSVFVTLDNGREYLTGNSYICSITCLQIGGWFAILLFLEHPHCEDCGPRVVILIPWEKRDPDLGRLVV